MILKMYPFMNGLDEALPLGKVLCMPASRAGTVTGRTIEERTT